MTEPVTVEVGVRSGDLRGSTGTALQAAVDYVAGLGGGVVRVGPGRYRMRNALFLRDRVRIVGAPGKTVLRMCPGAASRLRLDGDCNERQVTLADPSQFRPGDGVSVQDARGRGGFGLTTATLLERRGRDAFAISRPLRDDYMVAHQATVRLVFPVVAGYGVRDASVEHIQVQGNRGRTQPINGCRGAGIYLFECAGITIRRCAVDGYNGDGISFQVSHGVTVERCRVEGCRGTGLHPGSGSQRPVLRGNRARRNDGDGLFVCWRVKHGVFEENVLERNARDGLSIGHKDTDNVFRRNRIVRNRGDGLRFRDESAPMAAHRNRFEDNEILDNGATGERDGDVQIRILGSTRDLVFRKNRIGHTAGNPRGVGVLIGERVQGLTLKDNAFLRVDKERDEARAKAR